MERAQWKSVQFTSNQYAVITPVNIQARTEIVTIKHLCDKGRKQQVKRNMKRKERKKLKEKETTKKNKRKKKKEKKR